MIYSAYMLELYEYVKKALNSISSHIHLRINIKDNELIFDGTGVSIFIEEEDIGEKVVNNYVLGHMVHHFNYPHEPDDEEFVDFGVYQDPVIAAENAVRLLVKLALDNWASGEQEARWEEQERLDRGV